jgi:hypothetical protein
MTPSQPPHAMLRSQPWPAVGNVASRRPLRRDFFDS